MWPILQQAYLWDTRSYAKFPRGLLDDRHIINLHCKARDANWKYLATYYVIQVFASRLAEYLQIYISANNLLKKKKKRGKQFQRVSRSRLAMPMEHAWGEIFRKMFRSGQKNVSFFVSALVEAIRIVRLTWGPKCCTLHKMGDSRSGRSEEWRRTSMGVSVIHCRNVYLSVYQKLFRDAIIMQKQNNSSYFSLSFCLSFVRRNLRHCCAFSSR